MQDNSQNIYGSSRWSEFEDLDRKKLFSSKGLPFGFFDNKLLRYDTDSPRILVGGSGSGKLVSVLSYVLCLPNSMPMAILDPKGELWDISVHGLAVQGIFAYSWDPYRVGNIHHNIDPLDHLKPGRPTLFAEIRRLAAALLPLSQSANGKFFELTAQNILILLIYNEVLNAGRIDFPRLHELVYMIEGNLPAWIKVLESMLASGIQFLVTGARVIMRLQQDDPKLFGSVVGELYAYLMWLNDDLVRHSLKGGGASLQEIIDPSLNGGHPVRFHFKVPGDLMEQCAPILRVFFETITALKARSKGSARVLLLVDEAAMLGPFHALKDSYTYGRGTGITTLAVFQDLQQIESNHGRPAITTFLSSSAHRQFIGPRDIQTAGVISTMCGYQSLTFDDPHRQEHARFQMMEQVNALMAGADPFLVGQKVRHYRDMAEQKSKTKRALIEPAEVLAMRSDEAISFIDGDDLPPIFHNRYPYYELLKAGRFFPNPSHPPTDRIRVRKPGLFGRHQWLVVHRKRVPQKYAHFPQYADGYVLEIEGHPLP